MTKEPIGKTIFTGILLAIATAIVGYLVSSIQQNRRDQFNYSEEQRQEEVRRVNEQIEKL
jgi:H+/gluconate symporter-like permease